MGWRAVFTNVCISVLWNLTRGKNSILQSFYVGLILIYLFLNNNSAE
jgi:hypothetical protein